MSVADASGEMVHFLEMSNTPLCSGIGKPDWRLRWLGQMIQNCNPGSEVDDPPGSSQAILSNMRSS
jgi:hypothetical protein